MPDEFSAAELDLIQSQFNVITPENSMKPGPVHPQGNSLELGTARNPREVLPGKRHQDDRTLSRLASADESVVLPGSESRSGASALKGPHPDACRPFQRQDLRLDVVNEAISDTPGGNGENLAPRHGCSSWDRTTSLWHSSSRAKPIPAWRCTITITTSRVARNTRVHCCCSGV